MRVDTLSIRLRPRLPLEAADLGARLCRSAAPDLHRCLAVAAMPALLLAAASSSVSAWLPCVVIWWAQPWLDRTILFVLSRAAFGQRTTPSDLWQARRQVWGRHFVHTWTVRRLSPWRSLTQAVYQLEGSSLSAARARVRQIRRRMAGHAILMTGAYLIAELCLMVSLMSLLFWFTPQGETLYAADLVDGRVPPFLPLMLSVAYGLAVAFLEPFYVAAGFAMYLNRRAELEAWDLEQEFRRAFA